jgi:hypothetical protein
MKAPPGGAPRVHLAVVHGPHEVYSVMAARDRDALLRRLAHRLRDDVELQLFPQDADRFRALVDEARFETAVRFYFERVGRKWDPARLKLETVDVG